MALFDGIRERRRERREVRQKIAQLAASLYEDGDTTDTLALKVGAKLDEEAGDDSELREWLKSMMREIIQAVIKTILGRLGG